MVRGADAGNRGRTEFSEVEGGLVLPFFYAKSDMSLFVFYLSQKRGERNLADGGAKMRKFSDQLFQYLWKKVHLHMIMASNVKRDQMLPPSQPFFCRQSGL